MNAGNKNNPGFTLIEVLITMGMLALMAGIVGTLTMSDYFAYDFRAERNLAVSLLQKARAEAIANVNQTSHGLYIDTVAEKYVLFEGNVYNPLASTNEYIDFLSAKVTHTGMSEVVFSAIEGKATVNNIDLICTLNQLCLDVDKSIISINSEGQIQWTN